MSATARPDLLYLSPVVPAPAGNGLAMRAAATLEALAEDYAVHLLVIPVVAGPPGEDGGPLVSRCCARVAVHPVQDRIDPLYGLIARVRDRREQLAAALAYPRPTLCRFATASSIREAAQAFGAIAFREVHVFRAYLAPFAEPYLLAPPERRPTCRLDLDDHECVTHGRLADLHEARGDAAAGALERSEAGKYAALEERYLPLFDRIYVCSEHDRRGVAGRHGCRHVAVVPNAVPIPAGAAIPRVGRPPTLLFVGNLGYFPNEDAVQFLCGEILPLLRARAPAPWRVLVVGTHPSPRLRRLCRDAGATVTGPVADLGEWYAEADVAVIPLRAGGGTRIKLIEAFAHRRPVVSTTLGAEGVEARHGEHLLLADAPADFAAQCARLLETPALGRALAERAFALVTAGHTVEAVRQRLRRDHRGAEA